MEHYSVSVRLRRVITESAHISVPITDDLTEADPMDPTRRKLNAEKIFLSAGDQGKQNSARWELDGDIVIEPHPIQTPPPTARRAEN
jgi:hypothetical protein